MSPQKPRRRLPREQRRRLIEAGASRLFANEGYSGTTLEGIAAAAGVTKPLLYQHFRSKQELHLHLLAKHRDQLLDRLREGLAEPLPLVDRIPRVADAWFAYVEENPYAWFMLFRDTTGNPEVQRFYGEMQSIARAALAELIRTEPDLRLSEERIEPTAEFFRAAMTGLALWWADHRDVPRPTVAAIAADAVIGGLGLRSD